MDLPKPREGQLFYLTKRSFLLYIRTYHTVTTHAFQYIKTEFTAQPRDTCRKKAQL